jgi:hypothetical protein
MSGAVIDFEQGCGGDMTDAPRDYEELRQVLVARGLASKRLAQWRISVTESGDQHASRAAQSQVPPATITRFAGTGVQGLYRFAGRVPRAVAGAGSPVGIGDAELDQPAHVFGSWCRRR